MIKTSKKASQKQPLLSVVMATHNEAVVLPETLASIKGIYDELIVVDGESVDETVKIAKKFGAQVIQTSNKLNFHINKKMGLEKAKGKFVLLLDADERVDAGLHDFILDLCHKNQKTSLEKRKIVAWSLPRKNWFLGRYLMKGGQYPDLSTRLYINGKGILPAKDVHEQLVVDGSSAQAKGHLLHYSNPTFADYLRKFNHYTSFKAQQLYSQKESLSISSAFKHLIYLPVTTFLSLWLRHKGVLDGVPGFVFAVMSGLHHLVAYLKLFEKYQHDKHQISVK